MSKAALRARIARNPGPWSLPEAIEALESLGIRCERVLPQRLEFTDRRCLALVQIAGGVSILVMPRSGPQDWIAAVPGDLTKRTVSQEWVCDASTDHVVLLTKPEPLTIEEQSQPRGRYGHWFWGPIAAAKNLYWQVAVAALLTNVFALAASLFSMIVYDRVMPNGAFETLGALLIGVSFVLIGDFVIRTVRGYFLDVAGARADMVMADSIFDQVLEMRMHARKGSTGALASILREFDSLRELLTSATLTSLIDVPFALVFLAVIWWVGGPLAWVPLLVGPLVIAASVAVQPQLRRLVQMSYEQGHSKHSVLVETLSGIETIKSLGAGATMRLRWQEAVASQAGIGLRTRFIAQIAGNIANMASQIVWIGTVTLGVYLVADGRIGSGAIVACSMLAGRVIAPLGQLAQLLTRLNQSLASYRALNAVMCEPREHQENAAYIQRSRFDGALEFRAVKFSYPQQKQGGLESVSFRISPGERVAIIGRVGSGKTTIAKLVLGLYQPDEGAILVDGIDVRQIDPSEVRRSVGAVMQDIWLFSGTLKQNIAIGTDEPTDEDILRAAEVAGVHDFAASHPEGYGLRLRERGEGLSGGQRQAVAVARALIKEPPILLLDEPTSAMDNASERRLIERLKKGRQSGTLIVITHRSSLLDLVDRVIVIDSGRVVADGDKATVLGARAAGPDGAGGKDAPA